MKTRNLVLVRHGVTDWNEDGRLMGRVDLDINARGRAQAECVAQALADVAIDAVYSSPQPRARQTAEPIAAPHGLSVRVEPGFDEVWLSDEWKGKTVAELRGDADLERVIEDPTHRSEVIEPIAEVQNRSVAAAERLFETGTEQTLMVVSHGDPLRVLIAHYLKLEIVSFRRLACDNGSISWIRFNRRGPQLDLLNWVPRGLQGGSGKPAALQSS